MDEIGPDADLSFQSFIGHDFRDMDLSGVNFRRAILDRCNFQGSNLAGADFRKASLVLSLIHI